MDDDQKRFVILHELAHYKFNTTDELKADRAALHWYVMEGRPLSASILTLLQILNAQNKGHKKRIDAMIEHLRTIDAKVNINKPTKTIQQRMNNYNDAMRDAEQRWVAACCNRDLAAAKKAAEDIVKLCPEERKMSAANTLGAALGYLEQDCLDNFCGACSPFDGQTAEPYSQFGGYQADPYNQFTADPYDSDELEFMGDEIIGFGSDMQYATGDAPKKKTGWFKRAAGNIMETVGSVAGIKPLADAGSRLKAKGEEMRQKSATGDVAGAGVGLPAPTLEQIAAAEKLAQEAEEKRKKEAQEAEEAKKRKMWYYAGGGLAVVLTIVLIWYFMNRNK